MLWLFAWLSGCNDPDGERWQFSDSCIADDLALVWGQQTGPATCP